MNLIKRTPTHGTPRFLPSVGYFGRTIRHLMYYVYPIGDWRGQLRQLFKRLGLFNGRKILAVAYSQSAQIREVQEFVSERFDEILTFQNDPELREVVAFVPCLERVLTDATNEIIFTAHAKGVTHPQGHPAHRWATEMYDALLDYPEVIEKSLLNHGMVGCFRRYVPFPEMPHKEGVSSTPASWHYSGTFYWIRSYFLFRRGWRNIDPVWFGTESYPGKMFRPEECECLVGENCGDLYQQSTWNDLEPELKQWKEFHCAHHHG